MVMEEIQGLYPVAKTDSIESKREVSMKGGQFPASTAGTRVLVLGERVHGRRVGRQGLRSDSGARAERWGEHSAKLPEKRLLAGDNVAALCRPCESFQR